MQNYTLAFVRYGTEILVVQKNRPAWQNGRFNLVGGHMEEGEDKFECAVRELLEETGLTPAGDPRWMGTISGDWGNVYCVDITVAKKEIVPQEGETETFHWVEWDVLKNDPRLIPNLQVLIPLMMAGVSGWVMNDEGPITGDVHTMQITVKTGE